MGWAIGSHLCWTVASLESWFANVCRLPCADAAELTGAVFCPTGRARREGGPGQGGKYPVPWGACPAGDAGPAAWWWVGGVAVDS